MQLVKNLRVQLVKKNADQSTHKRKHYRIVGDRIATDRWESQERYLWRWDKSGSLDWHPCGWTPFHTRRAAQATLIEILLTH